MGKKSKKRKKKTKTKSAKTKSKRKKVQVNKVKNPSSFEVLLEKISMYKRWIPFGLIAFLVPLYVSYYPDDLVIKSKMLLNKGLAPNTLEFYNPNSYDIHNVKIIVNGEIDASYLDPSGNPTRIIKDSSFLYDSGFYIIHSKEAKHIVGKKIINMGDFASMDKYNFYIAYSFKTPFFYPNKSEIRYFSGHMDKNGDIQYYQN